MRNIHKFVEIEGNIFWFDKDLNLLSNCENLKETQLINLISKEIAFVKIIVSKDKNILTNCKLGINCTILYIDNDKTVKKKIKDNRSKIIWLTDQEIDNIELSINLLKKIVDSIFYQKIDMNPFKFTSLTTFI